MKRIVGMLLSAVLLFSLAACGIETAKKLPEEYIPSQDIEVAIAFVKGGNTDNARVVTRRTSQKALSGMELVCVYYDAQGKQLGEYEQVDCTFETKGTLSIWTFNAPAGCAYLDAAVASVTYEDGTKQACPGVSTWAQKTAKAFTLENHEKAKAEMAAKQVVEAEKCDAVEYSVDTPEDKKLRMELKNISGKEISEAVACLLWFDDNGAPIDMNGVLVSNSEKVSAKDLKPDEKATYTVDAPEQAASAKIIIQKVVFADQTVWENDYVYEWSVINCESAE
jgi:hypothetical protein